MTIHQMKTSGQIFSAVAAIAGYILLGSSQLLSQPYLFYMKPVGERTESIYRLDLNDGVEERFTQDVFRAAGLDWDATQTWLYVYQDYGPALVVNINQPSIRDTLPKDRSAGHVYRIFYVPQLKRFYVSWSSRWGSDTVNTTIYSSESFDSIGTVNVPVGEGGVLSRDGTRLYYVAKDSSDHLDYLYTFSTASNAVIAKLRFLDIGPGTEDKATEDGTMGELLIKYYYPSLLHENTYYFVYDLDSNSPLPAVHFPYRSYGFLSGDAKSIILEQVNWDTTRVSRENYTGIIYVFDAFTGELKQRLTLPPGGRILTFENFPDKFYYYNDSTDQSVTVSASVVTPSEYLIDSLISMKHQAVANGWLKVGMGHVRDIDEAMRPDRWYDESAYRHYRKWHPDKSWDFDRNWNSGIIGVLDKRLEKAKQALAREDSVTAQRDLEIFVMEVEVVRNSEKRRVKSEKSVMTSEAYTLLKYNAEYIIDRLPERQVRQEEGQRRKKK